MKEEQTREEKEAQVEDHSSIVEPSRAEALVLGLVFIATHLIWPFSTISEGRKGTIHHPTKGMPGSLKAKFERKFKYFESARAPARRALCFETGCGALQSRRQYLAHRFQLKTCDQLQLWNIFPLKLLRILKPSASRVNAQSSRYVQSPDKDGRPGLLKQAGCKSV